METVSWMQLLENYSEQLIEEELWVRLHRRRVLCAVGKNEF